MTEEQFCAFEKFRDAFRNKCDEWNCVSDEILRLSGIAAKKDTPEYSLENAVVYNRALDDLNEDSEIKIIVIGDNPGKNEQLEANRKYLVGQSGKLACSYFEKHGELGIDFRKNVIILNKTPVHTAKTKHLNYLLTNGSKELKNVIFESQKWMAENTAALHCDLLKSCNTSSYRCKLWLVGYSELKGNGVLSTYKQELEKAYSDKGTEWKDVKVYPHFSMNCFNRDVNEFKKENPAYSEEQVLEVLGNKHRVEVFGH